MPRPRGEATTVAPAASATARVWSQEPPSTTRTSTPGPPSRADRIASATCTSSFKVGTTTEIPAISGDDPQGLPRGGGGGPTQGQARRLAREDRAAGLAPGPDLFVVAVARPERVHLAHRDELAAHGEPEHAHFQALAAEGREDLLPAHEVVAHDVEVVDPGLAPRELLEQPEGGRGRPALELPPEEGKSLARPEEGGAHEHGREAGPPPPRGCGGSRSWWWPPPGGAPSSAARRG